MLSIKYIIYWTKWKASNHWICMRFHIQFIRFVLLMTFTVVTSWPGLSPIPRLQIDNIFIERFWRNNKYEKRYLEPSDNGLELYHKIKDYIKFYNAERLHQSLEYNKPEQMYLLASWFFDLPNWASQGTNLN